MYVHFLGLVMCIFFKFFLADCEFTVSDRQKQELSIHAGLQVFRSGSVESVESMESVFS